MLKVNLIVAGLLLSALLASGCSQSNPTTQPTSMEQRQKDALNDPFGYKPNFDNNNSISGGDIGHYDKDAMKKDIDHVLNP